MSLRISKESDLMCYVCMMTYEHMFSCSSPCLFFSVSEPLPMKLRALPQSFWQQPNNTNSLSPGAVYPVLPPLSSLGAVKDEVESVPAGNSVCTVHIFYGGRWIGSTQGTWSSPFLRNVWVGLLRGYTGEYK